MPSGRPRASMGPGSFDPGNMNHLPPPGQAGELQWGRGLLTPEMRQVAMFAGVPWPASMGPGSFDPGNMTNERQRPTPTPASMGPGSFDPGNVQATIRIAAN